MIKLAGNKIWDSSRVTDRDQKRFELTDLVRFKGMWFCSFREGDIHHSHPSGRGRVVRSIDGVHWETAVLLDWDGADVREPKFSITPEENLLVNTALYFCSREAREDGAFYQLNDPGTPGSTDEPMVARQSVAWLSSDGETWSSAYCCPTGVNTWRWEVAWHNGMGYSVGYGDLKNGKRVLYRTRDGKSWRTLVDDLHPLGNETSFAFDDDDTAYALMRDGKRRSAVSNALNSDGHEITADTAQKTHGNCVPLLGIGKAPNYQQWEWRQLLIDWHADGSPKPAEQVLRAPFGGPKLLRLSDGRFAAAARVMGPTQNDGHITVFLLDPQTAVLTPIAECGGTTYGSIVEHEGRLWVSFAAADVSAVFIDSFEIPEKV